MLTVDAPSQNGPIHVLANGSWVLNNFSWNHLADIIWIDQPVGMSGHPSLRSLRILVRQGPSIANRQP